MKTTEAFKRTTWIRSRKRIQEEGGAYESYIKGLFGLAQREKPTERLVFLCGTDLDDEVNYCWRYIKEMKKELIELKENKS